MRSPDPPPAVAGLEHAAMAEVWAHGGEVTVREVLESLNAREDRQRAYTTVMTVLARLHGKGLLTRRREGRALFYRAAITHEQYVRSRVSAEIDTLVSTYGDAALAQLAERVAEQDPRRLARLRALARRD